MERFDAWCTVTLRCLRVHRGGGVVELARSYFLGCTVDSLVCLEVVKQPMKVVHGRKRSYHQSIALASFGQLSYFFSYFAGGKSSCPFSDWRNAYALRTVPNMLFL